MFHRHSRDTISHTLAAEQIKNQTHSKFNRYLFVTLIYFKYYFGSKWFVSLKESLTSDPNIHKPKILFARPIFLFAHLFG